MEENWRLLYVEHFQRILKYSKMVEYALKSKYPWNPIKYEFNSYDSNGIIIVAYFCQSYI